MRPEELIEHLRASLDDGRMSRGERRALRETLAEQPLAERERRVVEAGVFAAAEAAMHDPRDKLVLRWLEDTLGALRAPEEPADDLPPSRAWFGPQSPLAPLLVSQLAAAQERIDAAVFTITDDRIAEALLEAHRRGVAVRVVTDDEKVGDPGSDIARLLRAGIEVRTDRTPAWMHHKFAVIDGRVLINGSYNWTRAGATENHENFLVTGEPPLVRAYSDAFTQLWDSLAPGS